MKLLLGDCLDKLKELEDNSVDSIVTDPPYGLSFMGKKWDYDVPSQDIWEECMRVLKPGGHLLSFAGSRTYHRMAVRIEDAGFEIRDQIMWIYGSGFPKSHNIGKAVDEKLGNTREVIGEKHRGDVQKAKQNGSGYLADPANRNNTKQFGYGTEIITKGNTEWEGWGTALKPAHEPIVMARKPISEKTIVDNVLEWGTGGINIDDSRINLNGDYKSKPNGRPSLTGLDDKYDSNTANQPDTIGRFPANIIFDEEAGKLLDEQSGISKSTGGRSGNKEGKEANIFAEYKDGKNNWANKMYVGDYNDKGGASRFFYCPKTSKTDRNEGTDNNHPTVKPTDLMLYLIRLVTPKGGTTLDPFMGSGSTGKAAVRGGFDFVGIEREKEYMEIAEARIQYEIDNPYKEKNDKKVEVKAEVVDKLNQFFGFQKTRIQYDVR
jgi:DNA modification methylase